MRPNPFLVTLAILGIGLLAVGAFLWLAGSSIPIDPESGSAGNGPVLSALGGFLMTAGWTPLIGWLVVKALQWVPTPAAESDRKSEAEIQEFLRSQRDPKGL
jgi:hypothetical protein